MSNIVTVTKDDIVRAYKEVGNKQGDILLTHSSLKSFGYVVGGPTAVIEAAKEVVTEEGTVVFPTLVQQDFKNSYKNWDVKTTPSDVGLITETFRKLPDSLRSDQATHSVAASGKLAYELTWNHTAYGPRMGIFGDYCFSYSSPWQKMYMHKAKIVFIGVKTMYNTFKHFVEYLMVEYCINSIKDITAKCAAMSEIAVFAAPGRTWPEGVWPFHNTDLSDELLESRCQIKYTICGNAKFTCICADEYVDALLQDFKDNPKKWFNHDFLRWMETYVFPSSVYADL